MTITAQNINASTYLSFGSTAGQETILENFTASGLTATMKGKALVSVAANTTDQSYSLANLTGGVTPQFIGVREVNGQPFYVATMSGQVNARVPVAANGGLMWQVGTTLTVPTSLYFTTPAGNSAPADIEVFVIG